MKKIEEGPFGNFKKFPKNFLKKVIFEQFHSGKKCKRGDPLGFFDIHCVAKYREIKGGPFGAIQKISKVAQCRKKVGLRWDP